MDQDEQNYEIWKGQMESREIGCMLGPGGNA